jgi:hypothetical protein
VDGQRGILEDKQLGLITDPTGVERKKRSRKLSEICEECPVTMEAKDHTLPSLMGSVPHDLVNPNYKTAGTELNST